MNTDLDPSAVAVLSALTDVMRARVFAGARAASDATRGAQRTDRFDVEPTGFVEVLESLADVFG